MFDNWDRGREYRPMSPDDLAMLSCQGWLSTLPGTLREAVTRRLRITDLPTGTAIYLLDDPPNGLHGVVAGEMRLISHTAAGTGLIALVATPGLWFGELSVLDGLGRPHDAIATMPTRLASLPMSAIDALAEAYPTLWRDIARLGCAHQRKALRNATRLQSQSAIMRLTGYLYGSTANASSGVISRTQDELAQIIGVSRQRINSLLRDLRAQGLVKISYGRIAVLDRSGLRSYIDRSSG